MEIEQETEYETNLWTGGLRNLEQVYERKSNMKPNDLNNRQKRIDFLRELRSSKDRKSTISETLTRIITDKETANELLKTPQGTRLLENILINEFGDTKYRRYVINELNKTTNNNKNIMGFKTKGYDRSL
jgi:hypothetical protein